MWQWSNSNYGSAKELIASTIDINLEIKDFIFENDKPRFSAFCSIDWIELMMDRDDFYMNPKSKIGNCYEWYSPNLEYYAMFRDPHYISKKFKESFPVTD